MKDKLYYEREATEEEYLNWYKEQDLPTYDKPSVTVDSVMFRYHFNRPQIMLIKRKAHPFKDKYALPGGFMDKSESALEAMIREVKEETNIDVNSDYVEQLETITTPGRDPRDWIITVAHLVYLPFDQLDNLKAGDDAAEAVWADVYMEDGLHILIDGQPLEKDDFAFDHWSIIISAMNRVAGRLDYNPTILQIMPTENTLTNYRLLYGMFDPKYKAMNSTDFNRKFKRFEKLDKISATATRKAHLYTHKLGVL